MSIQEEMEAAGLDRSNSLIAACGKADSLGERLSQQVVSLDEDMNELRARLADSEMISPLGRDDQILTTLKTREEKIAATVAELAEAGGAVDALFENLKDPVEPDL
ncbi:MAG: hypothetical protein KAH44_13645, partial [Oricola sp.]|nr:hypothetical protein [Oricola sp.]